MRARRHIAVIWTCLASLAAAGCGGGGSSSAPVVGAAVAAKPAAAGGGGGGSSSAPVVGAAFAAKATAACQTAHARKQAQGSFADPDFNPTKPDPAKLPAVAAFIAQGTAIYASWLQAMQALGAPPSGQDAWTGVLAAITAQLQQHEHQHAAALRGDTATFADDFARGAQAKADLERAAKAAGLPACATVEG